MSLKTYILVSKILKRIFFQKATNEALKPLVPSVYVLELHIAGKVFSQEKLITRRQICFHHYSTVAF